MSEEVIYDYGDVEDITGGYYYDPVSDSEAYRDFTPEERSFVDTGNTRFETGPDSFVDYRDFGIGTDEKGVIETGDGNSRVFYTPDGGMVEYSDISNTNAKVVTYSPTGKATVYNGVDAKKVLASLGKGLAGLAGLASGVTGKPAGGTPFGTSDATRGAGNFNAKQTPQYNVRAAAAGGLMSFADGGFVIGGTAPAVYDPNVAAELQKRLPGRELTDADYNYWTNNGGVEAVKATFPDQSAGASFGAPSRAMADWVPEGYTPIVGPAGSMLDGMVMNPIKGPGGDYVTHADSYYADWSPNRGPDQFGFVVGGGDATQGSGVSAPIAPPPTYVAPPPTPVSTPVAPQPYPYDPGDIYNPAPAYGNINDEGITPISTSETSMPAGAQPYTMPYEAVRYSSRLLQEGDRPGQAWNRGGGQVTYTQKAAGGGLMGLPKGDLGRYAGGGLGRLVKGPGDGVSDSIPATIDGKQPALIAAGEYVLPARVVSAMGNGSTDAGAARIDQMVAKIEQADKSAERGKDSGAYRFLG